MESLQYVHCWLQKIYNKMMVKTQKDLCRYLSVYLDVKDQEADQDGDKPVMDEDTMKQMNRAYARLLLATDIAHRCPFDEKVQSSSLALAMLVFGGLWGYVLCNPGICAT